MLWYSVINYINGRRWSSLVIDASDNYNGAPIVQNLQIKGSLFVLFCFLSFLCYSVLPHTCSTVKTHQVFINSATTESVLLVFHEVRGKDNVLAQKTNSLKQINGQRCFQNVSCWQTFIFYWSLFYIAGLSVTVRWEYLTFWVKGPQN